MYAFVTFCISLVMPHMLKFFVATADHSIDLMAICACIILHCVGNFFPVLIPTRAVNHGAESAEAYIILGAKTDLQCLV